ncbi:MAG TPA: hypothetical protein DCZ73_04320 [Bacteroides sp.]|nr:hypothetical protein [Bacteroides sp.]
MARCTAWEASFRRTIAPEAAGQPRPGGGKAAKNINKANLQEPRPGLRTRRRHPEGAHTSGGFPPHGGTEKQKQGVGFASCHQDKDARRESSRRK